MKLTKQQKDFIEALDFAIEHDGNFAYLTGVLIATFKLSSNKEVRAKIHKIIDNDTRQR